MSEGMDLPVVCRLVEEVRPILAGHSPEVIGAALADLVAIWLAGHVVAGDIEATDRRRGELMLMHAQAVRHLTAINALQLGTYGGVGGSER
jgi:hypothetical protein